MGASAHVINCAGSYENKSGFGGVREMRMGESPKRGRQRQQKWGQTIGWCTVTSLVPSGKVASTWMSRNHLGDAVHHIGAGQHGAAFAHELRHGLAVACAFHHGGADQGHRLGVVELQPPGLAALGQQGGGEDQQLVFFAGSQFHIASLPHQTARLPEAGRTRGGGSMALVHAIAVPPSCGRQAPAGWRGRGPRPCLVRTPARTTVVLCTMLECKTRWVNGRAQRAASRSYEFAQLARQLGGGQGHAVVTPAEDAAYVGVSPGSTTRPWHCTPRRRAASTAARASSVR